MPDVPSFQDLLSDFSAEIFVGRAEQLALFEKALIASHPPFLILDVSGQGGVGKTTLLEQFRRVAKNYNVLTALANEDQTSVPATLADLAQQFGEAGHPFKTFDERYRKYRELREQVEADPNAPKGLLDFALRSAARIGFRVVKKRVPLVEEATEVLLSPQAEEVIVEQTSAFADYVAQKFANKDEKVLLLETDAELTRQFLPDFNKLAQSSRVVLFFDTYEKTASYLNAWLLDLLGGKYGTFSGNVLFIITGRYPLGQAWTRFRKAIQQIELHEFTEAEAREYLARSGVTDEVQIVQMLKLSNRLPVLLALLVSAPGDVPTEVAGNAVERFLQGATSEQRAAALVASVPRFFNQDILAVILDPEAADTAFEWLSQAAFVRSTAQGWTYHDVVRSMMLHYFCMRSAERYIGIHGKLAEYYSTQAQRLGLQEDKQRGNETWRRYETERLYHQLSCSPASGLEEALIGFLEDRWSKDRSILQGYARTLTQVSDEGDEVTLKTWAGRLQRLTLLPDESAPANEVKEFVLAATFLCDFESLEDRHRSQGFLLRGRGQRIAKDYSAASGDFSKAIELQPEYGDNYYWRGRTYSEMKEYAAALADFTKGIELQPEDGYNYLSRGLTHRKLEDYPPALADFTKAIELQPEHGDNYWWRGLTYREMKEYPAALADFTKAIELQLEDGDNYWWRGLIYRETKDYPAALADFTKAIELQPEDSYNYELRGLTHHKLKDYPAALADFTKAIELQPEDSYNYLGRGRTYSEMKDHPAALADLTKAIELQPEDGVNYLGRGRTYLEMKDHPAALADFTKAIELQPEDGDNYYWRGRTNRLKKDYPAALADFSRGIDLQPQNFLNYLGRGRTSLEMKDFSTALADFNKAIELQPEDGDNYYWRGRVYWHMKNNAAALADLNKAVELQPENVYDYAWRGRIYLGLSEFANAHRDFTQVVTLLKEEGRPAYYVAGGYAALAQVEEACTWLRRAFEQEKALINETHTDSDFDPIRETADFKALMAEFDKSEGSRQ